MGYVIAFIAGCACGAPLGFVVLALCAAAAHRYH